MLRTAYFQASGLDFQGIIWYTVTAVRQYTRRCDMAQFTKKAILDSFVELISEHEMFRQKEILGLQGAFTIKSPCKIQFGV